MAEDKKLLSVLLHLEKWEFHGSTMTPGAFNIRMELSALVPNEDVLQKVHKQFSVPFELPIVEDLKGMMLKVLKEDNAHNEQKVRDLEVQLMNERKAHMQTREELQNVRDLVDNTFSFFNGKTSG